MLPLSRRASAGMTPRERVDVFRWRMGVCLDAAQRRAPFDGRVSTELLAFAVLLSHSAKRAGDGITLARVRDVFGERMVRRYLSTLAHAGYVEMTQRPARGRIGKPGRVAEYALTLPCMVGNAAHEDAEKWAAKARTQVGSVVLSVVPSSGVATRTTLPTSRAQSVVPLEEHSPCALRVAA